MRKINLTEFIKNKNFFIQEAQKGKIFLYPTDTIYGLGGIWELTLEKIYSIKNRPKHKKVSIILPAKDLKEFLEKIHLISIEKLDLLFLEKYILNLRGKKRGFTLIIKAKEKFLKNLNNFGKNIYKYNTIGIRYLNHPFQNFINKLNKTFITTSANLSGEPPVIYPSLLNLSNGKTNRLHNGRLNIEYGILNIEKPPFCINKKGKNYGKVS